MAKKVHITIVDDIDGSEAAETVEFGLDGARYTIDLSAANAELLRKNFASYTDHAVKAGRQVSTSVPRSSGAKSAAGKRRPDAARTRTIREWAKARGHEVSGRGRIGAQVVAAFEADERERAGAVPAVDRDGISS